MLLPLVLLSVMAPLSLQAADDDAVLNIYNWADYIDPELIEEFSEEYGIHVNYDVYDSSEIVDTKLMTGGSGYDIVVHAASFSARLTAIGVYRKVDFQRLNNWQHMDQDLIATVNRQFPGELVGVPYMWGTTGVSYNVDMIRERMPDAPVHSASLIFDPEVISKFADCGVSFLDDPITVIPMAMIYLGYPANSVDPEHLKAAEKLLTAVRPYIKYFSSTKMLLDLPSKEVCMAMSWSGDYSVAASRAAEAGLDIDLAYSIPQEGSISWYDIAFIPSDAPHPENALLFLNFIMRPQIIARATNFIGYANANLSSREFVDSSIADDPAIYPDEVTLKRLYPTLLLDPKIERRRARTWTRIKSGL